MGFTKTIVHKYSDIYRFTFNDFIIGSLSLLQYGIDNNINVKLNIEASYINSYIVINNADTYGYPTKYYSNETDLDTLYNDLEEFKTNTAPIMVVTTNWRLHSSRVSDLAVLELKKLVIIIEQWYDMATDRVVSQLINIHLPHVNPIIKTLTPENHVYIRDPRTHTYPVIPAALPTDYNIIYVDISEKIQLNHLDTVKLADTIRGSLILNKNIILISSNKILGNLLTELLEVVYAPNLVEDVDDSSEPLETLSWEPLDEVINYIIFANAKKLFVFSEQSKPVTESYLAAKQVSNVSIQMFKFFYSKVEISPMPMYH